MDFPTTNSPAQSPAMSAEDAKARDFARSRIAALMDDSDSDDAGEEWKPKLTDIPSSSQEEQAKSNTSINYDLDLDDEDVPAQSSHFEDASVTAQGDDDDGSAAYARMMKSFLTKKKPAPEPPSEPEKQLASSSPAKSIPADTRDDSSDEDMPVTKTMRKARPASSPSPARSSSPRLPQAARSPSPDLFVSPARSRRDSPSPKKQIDAGSDSDDMPMTVPKSRFQALVAQKKAQREAKEQEEQAKKQAARKEHSEKQKKLAKHYKEIYSSEMDDGMTEEARDALVENSRPTQRKASKKAIEEMNRETQRMARNQQLTHIARVKKKYSTLDFMRDFGMSKPDSDDESRARGPLVSSDAENHKPKDTPPSSPPSLRGSHKKSAPTAADNEDEYIIRTGPQPEEEDEELPDIETILSEPVKKADKGKGKAVPSSPPRQVPVKQPRKQIRVSAQPRMDDSDDELEIVAKKPSRFAVFDKLPERRNNEPKALLSFRALAHMSPPSKNQRNGRQTMTHAELQRQLAQQMHKQTVAEKQERIAELRARGIEFKTEEEIEEDQLYVENMLEKARKEAMELGRKENEAAKKNGEEIDENYALPSDDEEEDADFEEEEEDDEADVEMSGSEDEGAGDEDRDDGRTGMFDDAAEEADGSDEEAEDEAEDDLVMADGDVPVDPEVEEDDSTEPHMARSRARNRNVVLDDDDEEEEQTQKPPTPAPARGSTYTSPVNAAFGFAMPAADLSLTQMFKGTMEDLATQDDTTQATPARQSLDFLRDAPAPTLPDISPAFPAAGLLVPSSQANMITPSKPHHGTAGTPGFTPQFPTPAAIGNQMSPSKMSEIPEPTQDAGFDSFPGTHIAQPHSTVDTVMMPIAESPVAQKKGKPRRRVQTVAELSEDEAIAPIAEANDEEDEFELNTNAFDALFKSAKRKPQPDAFDRKTSEVKRMFEEQAEESEDEYAGLGGASDDESDNGIDEEVQKMIDEGPVDVKEGELAKFYADKDRADDEKRIDRLYKDITTGALRRKRGVGVDELSDDSDDEAAERRRRKQAEFRKMRQALLMDENVGKIAENPKKSAFLKAIEDREDDDGIDYLGDVEETADSQPDDTQGEQTEATGEPESNVTANMSLKRKLPADFTAGKENITPNMSHRRRPAGEDGTMSRKPIGLQETRESISFLLEDAIVPDSQVSDQSDDDAEDEDEDGPTRRVRQRRNDGNGSAVLTSVRASVINRLTVSRQNSLTTEDDAQPPTGPMAFHASTSASGSGVFKLPSLLRRATTNLSNASNSSSGTTTPIGNENTVRMGGSKRSNIHFQAREAERMKKVREAEVRRREGIRKSVVGKGRVSVLGNSLGGRHSGFE